MYLVLSIFQILPSVSHHAIVQLPPTPRKSKPAKRCRVCYSRGKRKESRYYCPLCPSQPGLCPKECFDLYHSNTFFNLTHLQRPRPSQHSTNLQADLLPMGTSASLTCSTNTSPHSTTGPELFISGNVPSNNTYMNVVEAWQNEDNMIPVSPHGSRISLPPSGKNDTTPSSAKPFIHEGQRISLTPDRDRVKQSPASSVHELFSSLEEEHYSKRMKGDFTGEHPDDNMEAKPLLKRRSSARLRRLSSTGGSAM